MRLPWPFRRSAPDGDATAAAAHGTVQRAVAPVRRDWASTGDLRPSFLGDPGIRVQRFPDDIAGSQLPPPILAPLGHARTADGPAGLVSGLARPTLASVVHGSGGHAELPLRQRRGPAATVQRAVADQPPIDGPVDQARAVPSASSPATPMDAVDTAVAATHGLPVVGARRAAVVPMASSTTRPQSLTVARTPDLALAPARGVTPSEPATGSRPGPAAAPAAARSGASAMPGVTGPTRTILRTASGSRVRLGPPIQRSALEAGAPPLELAHQGRDVAPATPPAASIQRHPASDEAAHDHADRRPDAGAPLVGGLSTTLDTEPLPAGAPDEPAPGIPGGLVLARVVATRKDDLQPEPIARASDPPGDIPRSVAPLVGDSPIAPSAGLRPTVPTPSGSSAPTTEPTTSSSRVRGDGTRGASRAIAQRATAGSGREGGRPAIPAGTAVGGLTSPTPVALPRVARVSATGSDSAGARPPVVTSPSPATPGLVLARTPIATIASAHDQPSTGSATRSMSPRLAVLRAAMDEAPPEQDPEERETTGSTTTAGGSTTMPSTAASAAPGGATSVAERDLEEMVRRLYPRLRRSLSSELLVARERAGTLADLR